MSVERCTESRTMPKNKSGIKESEYKEWLVESLSHIPVQDSDELNLEIPTFEIDQFTSLSTDVERHEDAPEFDVSLDSWLRGLVKNGTGESGESCSIRPELMLSPHAIRAPLRSVRPDKRALMRE
jgi:hypothetical protein